MSGPRFKRPRQPTHNPLDMNGPVIGDLNQRNVIPVEAINRVSLATAGQLSVNIPGTALVIYGSDGASPPMNVTSAYVQVQFNNDSFNTSQNYYPMKHARGIRTPFSKFTLNWPAQASVYIDIVIHQYEGSPWVDGESCT